MMSGFPMVLLYIDPGIFILVLQFVVAGLLGIVFFFRRTTRQVLNRLRLPWWREGEERE